MFKKLIQIYRLDIIDEKKHIDQILLKKINYTYKLRIIFQT
jgi:hypothetical protein